MAKQKEPEKNKAKQVSRRDFIKAGGAVIASAAIFGALDACSPVTSTVTSTTQIPTTTTQTTTTTTTVPTTITTTSSSTTLTTSTTPTLTPKSGGTLKIGTGLDAVVLGNPPTQTTVQDFALSKTCVESLGRFDANGVMSPWLASSWKTDPVAKTITISLRPGVKFHDGTTFNADAAKWNFDRFFAAKRTELAAGTTATVTDSSTVVLTLPAWDNTAITAMGYFAGPMISPTAYTNSASTDADRITWAIAHPVGTGPFQFVSWNKTVSQVYKKFPDYWGGTPYLDGIEWDIYADPTVMQAAYLNKDIDMMYIVSPISAVNLKNSGANIVQLTTGLGLQMLSVWYNSANTASPFNNLQVRQAISYAVNAPAITASLYYGLATPLNQWAVPNSQWYNPNFNGYPTDPTTARQMLAAAGYAGLHTHMLTLNTPDTVAVATALQAMFATIGMTVDLDIAENARYRSLTSPGGSFDAMCLASQRADTDPALIFPRNLSASGVIMNATIIHPDAIENGLTAARQAPDQATKVADIQALQKTIFGDYCIFTPLLVPSGVAAKQSYVQNDGMMQIEYTQWTPEKVWLNK